MRRLWCHPSSLLLAACLAAGGPLAAQQAGSGAVSVFTVLSAGRVIGTAASSVSPTADGWTITASENLGPPLDLTTSRLQLRYSRAWQPISLSIEGTQASQAFRLATTFADGTARTQGVQRGQPLDVTHRVAAQTVVLPSGFFPAYEALAARLGSVSVGDTLSLYIAPQGSIDARLTRVTPRRLSTPAGSVELRQFDLLFDVPSAPVRVEVWADERGRLGRLAIPASRLVVIRDDISSVMTREVTVTRPGDEEVFIPGNGFSIAGTMSPPDAAAGPSPAVILVGGTGRQDRDEVTAGVPVFGFLANALADAGFVVVRYDKRGVGRSGGRVESATLGDYADDALRVLRWLRDRPEVDEDRIAVLGYSEGAATAMLAARREKDVAALCLIAPPGQTGRDFTLRQQQQALASSDEPEAQKAEAIALQERVIAAVLGEAEWADVPAPVRREADTAYFRSWLEFSPDDVMEKLKQPVLIVTGGLDTEFPPGQANRLEALARLRKKLPADATRKIIVPGVNHLLVSADSGQEDEYSELSGETVPASVTTPIAEWLKAAMPAEK